MCGIIYARAKNKTGPASVNKYVLKAFKNQRSRGVKGFGIFDFDYEHLIKEPTERRILKWMKNHPTSEMLFHHRMPTSTENVKNACHPFSSGDYFGDIQYVLIHNGVISNYKDMAKEHIEKGIKYSSVQMDGTFNDSEALMWDVALYLHGDQSELKSKGSVAFIVLEKHKGNPQHNKLHWFHNAGHTTLYKQDNHKVFMLSSQGGTGASPVELNQLFTYSYKSDTTSQKYLWLPSAYYSSSSSRQPATPYADNAEPEQTPLFTVDDDEDTSRRVQLAMAEEYDELERKQLKLLSNNRLLSKKVRGLIDEYMAYADGYYAGAIYLLRSEMKKLSEESYSLVNWYNIQALGGAVAALLADRGWDGESDTAQHPVYKEGDAKKIAEYAGAITTLEYRGPSILEQVSTNKGVEAMSSIIARTAAKMTEKRHSVGETPALVSKIPVAL